MTKQQSREWEAFLRRSLEQVAGKPALRFSEMTPSSLPVKAGVYLLTKVEGSEEWPYYVGTTTNIRQRLYNNHLMGPLANARLKKYLIDDETCSDKEHAKAFIRENCAARWIEEEDFRKRGAVEGFFTAMLFPKYGIAEEH